MLFPTRITSYRIRGGGPAPLIYNPHPYVLRLIGFLHSILFILALLVTFITSFITNTDKCPAAGSTLFGFDLVVVFLTLFVFLYFWLMSIKKLGSEIEWVIVIWISAFIAISEGATAFWGSLFFYNNISSAINLHCIEATVNAWLNALIVIGLILCTFATSYVALRLTSKIIERLTALSEFK